MKYVVTIHHKKRKPKKLVFTDGQGRIVMAAINLSELEPVRVFRLVALDNKNRPVPITVAPVWSNSNPGAVDLVLSPTEQDGQVMWLDGGLAKIGVTVEMRPGVVITAVPLEVTCAPAEAVSLEIQLI